MGSKTHELRTKFLKFSQLDDQGRDRYPGGANLIADAREILIDIESGSSLLPKFLITPQLLHNLNRLAYQNNPGPP